MTASERIQPSSLGLGKLFYAARDAIVVGDPRTGEVVLWNKAAEAIFGYTEEEALGRPLEELVPKHLKEAHRTGLARFAATGHGPLVDSGHVAELPALRKDGTQIVIELTLTPLKSEDGVAHFAMAVIRDVTERKRSQDDLERANQELLRLNESMKDFVSIASHDLRSPVTTILGFANTIKVMLEAKGEVKEAEFAAIIERQARRLSDIIESVLTLTRIESGFLDAAVQAVDVADAVQKAIDPYLLKGEVFVQVDPGIQVSVDPDHLQRILENLLSNAVRYGAFPIEVKGQREANTVKISVSDAGDGVSEEFQEHLFEKFARAEASASLMQKGTGLGLSIVKGLAQANAGTAWYCKNSPCGSIFGVTLQMAVDGSR